MRRGIKRVVGAENCREGESGGVEVACDQVERGRGGEREETKGEREANGAQELQREEGQAAAVLVGQACLDSAR